MQKILGVLIGLSLSIFTLGPVGAAPITLNDTTVFTDTGTDATEDLIGHGSGKVNVLEGALDYVKWVHQFEYDPLASEILGGTLTISLFDDEKDTWNLLTLEVAITSHGINILGIDEVDTGNYQYNIDAHYLEGGRFEVQLTSLGGDIEIKSSTLEVDYNPVSPVPEPATLLLIGTGLVGFAGQRLRTKFRS